MRNTTFKRDLLITVIGISLFLFGSQVVSAEVVFGGRGTVILEDTTWTKEAGPYILLGKVRVVEGYTLTIEPGTIIKGDSEGGYSW